MTSATSTPTMPAPAATPAEAQGLANRLMSTMAGLLEIIEEETALARSGNVRAAIALDGRKSELSREYLGAVAAMKGSQSYLMRKTPDLWSALHRQHEVFRAMLQVNMTVLATAHAVSEGIVRGVNVEMQKKRMPQTYTAAGQRAMPTRGDATPLAVSRVM